MCLLSTPSTSESVAETSPETDSVPANPKPEPFTFNEEGYYSLRELYDYDVKYFNKNNCKSQYKKILKEKNILNTVIYIKKRTDTEQCSSKYNKAIVGVPQIWVEKNIPSMLVKNENGEGPSEKEIMKMEILHDLPPLIILKDEQKIRDDNGNICEIETRGELGNYKKIYFKCEDMSEMLEYNIYDTITKPHTDFELNKDYIKFIIAKTYPVLFSNNKGRQKQQQIFLTYDGFMKLLYKSKSKNAKRFRVWANDLVFTYHLGDQNAKDRLHAQNRDKDVMPEGFSCIYLYLIQNYEQDNQVLKYGRTEDLARRHKEHLKKYESQGYEIKSLHYVYIDPLYTSTAEKDFRSYLKDMEIHHEIKELSSELIKIPTEKYDDCLKHIKKQMNQLNQLYAPTTKYFQELLQSKDALLEEKDKQLENKDAIIEVYKETIVNNEQKNKETIEIYKEANANLKERLEDQKLTSEKVINLYEKTIENLQQQLSQLKISNN